MADVVFFGRAPQDPPNADSPPTESTFREPSSRGNPESRAHRDEGHLRVVRHGPAQDSAKASVSRGFEMLHFSPVVTELRGG